MKISKNIIYSTRSKGFTLLELLVSIGIMTILVSFSTLAYLNVQKNSDLANQTAQLVSSIRQAQILATTGQTQDQENQLDVGLFIGDNNYILFYGSSFNPDNPSNIITTLPSSIILSSDITDSSIIFEARSGEVKNYDSNKNSITIFQSASSLNIIKINRLGVVDIN